MPHRRPVLITSGRHPVELGVLWALTVTGSVAAAAGIRPPALAAMPEPLLTGWLSLLAVGGLVGIVGAYWSGDADTGLLVEASGVFAVASACTLYGIALVSHNPIDSAFVAAGFVAGAALGCWVRAVQAVREVRKLWRAAPSYVPVDLPLLVEPDPEPDDPAGFDPAGPS